MTEMQAMRSAGAGGDGHGSGSGGGLEWSSSPPSSGAIASLHGEGGGAFDGPIGGGTGSPGQTGQPGGGNGQPNGVQSFFSSPFASVGVEYGKTLLRDNSLLSGGLGGWLRGSRLRFYFRVSQQSTRRKIGKLLLPYIHSDWRRQVTDESDAGLLEAGAAATGDSTSVSFQPPSADLNAPDLYLGSMAFVTFVVTMGFAMGSLNQSVMENGHEREEMRMTSAMRRESLCLARPTSIDAHSLPSSLSRVCRVCSGLIPS